MSRARKCIKQSATISMPCFGGAWAEWHNTHHAFPTSAQRGVRWWWPDTSDYTIRLMAPTRLTWNVKLPSHQARDRARRRAGDSVAPQNELRIAST
jgi:fatty-acid desaturase